MGDTNFILGALVYFIVMVVPFAMVLGLVFIGFPIFLVREVRSHRQALKEQREQDKLNDKPKGLELLELC